MTDFTDWTDERLLAYEESLFDDAVAGADNWPERDAVLWEMNRRGLCG